MAVELFGPSDVPKTVGLSDFRSIDLTAEEGFLLSRIDGRTNVRSLLTLVSWDKDKTFALLESLTRKHLVNFDRDIFASMSATAAQPTAGPNTTVTVNANSSVATAGAAAIDRKSLEKVPDLEEDRCAEIIDWERRTKNAVSLYELFSIPDGADVRSVKREYTCSR